MGNEIRWSTTLGTFTTLIAGAGVAPSLKNLADAALQAGNAITGNRHRYCGLHLKCRFATSPNSYGVVEVYFVPSVDGSVYADGSASVVPAAHLRAACLSVKALTTQQQVADSFIMLPPFDFIPVLYNRSGAAMTNTDNENILSYRTYNEEVQ